MQDSVDSREVLGCADELGGLKNSPQMFDRGTPHGPHKDMSQPQMKMTMIHTSDGNTALDIEDYKVSEPAIKRETEKKKKKKKRVMLQMRKMKMKYKHCWRTQMVF